MRQARLLAITGLVTLLLSLVALVPARVALPLAGVPAGMANGLAGTLWSGSAQHVTVSGIAAGPVRWQLKPLRLLLGQVAAVVDVRLPDGFVSGQIALSLGGDVAARDIEAAAPLALLAPSAGPMGPGSQVTARFEQLIVDDGKVRTAVGTIQLAGVVLPLPSVQQQLAAGSYSVSFAAKDVPPDQPLTGDFHDTGGPVEISGAVKFTPPRSYEVNGKAKARPNAPEELRNALQMLGPALPDGAHTVSLAGSF